MPLISFEGALQQVLEEGYSVMIETVITSDGTIYQISVQDLPRDPQTHTFNANTLQELLEKFRMWA